MNYEIKEDLRIVKTKKALREALLKLIAEKSYDKISVTEICDKALINRMTYYKYFKDKNQLLNHLFEVLSNDLVSKVKVYRNAMTKDEGIDSFLCIIKETYLFCLEYIDPLTSIAEQCNFQIINTLSKVCLEHINVMFTEIAEKYKYKYPVDQVSTFVFGGFGALLYFWLSNRTTYTYDKVCDSLDKLGEFLKNSNLK